MNDKFAPLIVLPTAHSTLTERCATSAKQERTAIFDLETGRPMYQQILVVEEIPAHGQKILQSLKGILENYDVDAMIRDISNIAPVRLPLYLDVSKAMRKPKNQPSYPDILAKGRTRKAPKSW